MADDRDIEIALCVFREANDALIVFDPRDRRVVDVNPVTLRLTRLDRKQVLASKITDLIGSPDPDKLLGVIAASETTGFFLPREGFELVRRDGQATPVSVGVSRIHTRPNPLGLAIIRDVSARVKAEAELNEARETLESRVRERTAELAEANEGLRREVAGRIRVEDELRRAQKELESAARVKDRFLAVLSHELRTPLTPVMLMVSALLENPECPQDLRPALEMIRRNVSLEARLIDDLLDAMRAGQGKLRLEREVVDALGLIHQTVEICRPGADETGVRIVVKPGARSHSIDADPTRFQQVVWNLIQNAVKFTPAGGIIVVATADSGDDRLAVSVADDGRGIEPEILPKIFEPFEQGEMPRLRRVHGLGLGLSIGRSIVEGHGGRISAASEGPGRGSTITFDMPLAHGPTETTSGTGSTAPTRPGPARSAVILVVEDNKDVVRYLKLVLEMKGHQVRTAVDLASAFEASEEPFDLLISDIELPDGSGLDIMRRLRGQVPGIAISGFGAPDDVSMSLDAGFARHLTKPVEVRHLDAAIEAVLARP